MKKIEYNGKEILPPKSDIVFKSIFGKEPSDRLVDFLNNTLGLSIESKDDITICNPEIDKDKESDKFARLDLKIRTKDKLIDVEVQIINEKNIVQRALYYLACLIKDSEPPGSKYDTLTTSIVVFICDFIIRKEDDVYHEIYKMLGKKTGSDLKFPARIHLIELPKFNKNSDVVDNNKWMHFLTINDKIELEKVKEKDPIMSNSIDRLLYISSDEKLAMQYEARQNEIKDEERRMNSSFSAGRNEGFEEGKLKGIKEGKLKGIKEGKLKGIKEGKLEGIKEGKLEGVRDIARRMKDSGYNSKFITEMTGLTEEEINNIN